MVIRTRRLLTPEKRGEDGTEVYHYPWEQGDQDGRRETEESRIQDVNAGYPRPFLWAIILTVNQVFHMRTSAS